MATKKNVISCMAAGFGIVVMILDSKTALTGAAQGIDLCIRTVIPSLFPFIVLSMFLTGLITGVSTAWLRPLGRFLRLPSNAEPIFLIGLLGGYPMGAQCIRQAYEARILSREDAQRMLRFCNNAGPAFLFGMGVPLLGGTIPCFCVWLIHVLSAVIVARMTPQEPHLYDVKLQIPKLTLTEAVQRAANVMLSVCSWIILFRILLNFLYRWVLWMLPEVFTILISGLLELSNGSQALKDIQSLPLRFVLFSTMLGFGGLCVGLQTDAVLAGGGLSIRPYFLGKVVQGLLSCLMSILLTSIPLLKSDPVAGGIWVVLTASPMVACFLYKIWKNRIAFFRKMVYTGHKFPGGNTYETVSKKG